MARTGAALLAGTADPRFSDERLNAAVLWRSPGPDANERPRYLRTEAGVALVDPSGESAAVHAVFGSGLRGVTPVHFTGEGEMRELRVTWSHGRNAWIETPGSEGDRHPLGDLDSPRAMRECVGCHATAAAWDGPAPDLAESEWGVRCERCHGPGEAHAGTTDARLIFNPGRLPPAEEVRFCGQCHRTPTDFEPLQVLQRDSDLARHAAGSLMMSACFRTPSPERTISCTDCHDPHRAESSVAERSRTICRRCHEDPAALHDSSASPRVRTASAATCRFGRRSFRAPRSPITGSAFRARPRSLVRPGSARNSGIWNSSTGTSCLVRTTSRRRPGCSWVSENSCSPRGFRPPPLKPWNGVSSPDPTTSACSRPRRSSAKPGGPSRPRRR